MKRSSPWMFVAASVAVGALLTACSSPTPAGAGSGGGTPPTMPASSAAGDNVPDPSAKPGQPPRGAPAWAPSGQPPVAPHDGPPPPT